MTGTDVEAAPTTDGTWHRLHPLTPLVRSWAVVAAALVFYAQQRGERLGQRGGRDRALPLPADSNSTLVTGGIFGVIILLALVIAVLAWRFSRYRVTSDALELHTGIVNRQQRHARLDRLQAVDVVQPIVARLLGLAELRVEVAGGRGSKLKLAYLREADARQLRNALLARAAGLEFDTPQAPEAPEQQVLRVPVERVLAAMLLSAAPVLLVILALVVAAFAAGTPAPLLGFIPFLLGVSGELWRRFNRAFDFRVAVSPDGIRLRHGLTEARSQTVPPGRVQAVRFTQPLLWRPMDWWRLHVNVAGYGGEQGRQASLDTVLLPVASRREAFDVLALIVPDLGEVPGDSALVVLEAGLAGRGAAGGFTPSPRSARWLDPISWSRHGFVVTGRALLARRGALRRELDVVPHERTQSLGVVQGPLQRRLGLASFALHSTPGPVRPTVEHLAAAVAGELLVEQAARARQARTVAAPHRWMERGQPPEGQPLEG